MNVTVAVIDSGVDASHPDLAGKVINGVDYRDGFSYLNEATNLIDNCVSYTNADYSDTGRTKPVHVDFGKYDPNGHGTHVAGIIASNGIGVKSVAPQAKIMPVRVMSEQGTGDMSDVACGIIYAANNGAQVINMSLGFEPSAIATVPDENAAIRAAVEYAISKNVVVVAATGNDGTTGVSFLPADLPNVIGVGAVYSSSGNSIASFSNRGNFVDVVAPGVGIWSTCSANPIYDVCTTSDGDSRYESLDGTSMATPFVSGLAALVLSMDGNLKNSDVASIITASAIDKGAVGYDQIYGYGLINAPAAITKAQEWTRQNTEKILAAQIKAAADAELARLAEVARLAEIERLATEKAAADKAAADKAAADAEAARVAAEKAAALSAMSKSLKVKALTKQRISILVTAPAGSRTIVQQKVGRIWKTVTSTSAIKSRVLKVSKLGYYRVQITSPNGTATSSIVRVK
jgi:subtilisin family serine protease